MLYTDKVLAKEVYKLLGSKGVYGKHDGRCEIGEVSSDGILVTILADKRTWKASLAEVKRIQK